MLQPSAVAMASTADIWRHGLLRPSEEQLKPNLECAGMYLVLEGPVLCIPYGPRVGDSTGGRRLNAGSQRK